MSTSLPPHARIAGSGIPIVFIHAYPLTARMWAPQIAGLSDAACVITYDLPGFGLAPLRSGATSMATLADDCIHLLDAAGKERAVLCGCSLGGYIALSALGRHADRIAGLVLANTRASADTPEGAATRRAQAATARKDGSGSLTEALLPKLLAPHRAAIDPDMLRLVRSMMEEAIPEGVARMLEAMADRPATFDHLRSSAVPVCVIAGEADQLIPLSESEIMAETAPISDIHVLPDCGHLSCLEAPDAFNGILRDFLRGIAL